MENSHSQSQLQHKFIEPTFTYFINFTLPKQNLKVFEFIFSLTQKGPIVLYLLLEDVMMVIRLLFAAHEKQFDIK